MITFQDKVALNDNPDIPDINKIKDSDINALKNNINTLETNSITNNTYSTSETNTGQTWIDGKPIYRKVFNTGAITTTNAFVEFNSGISNFSSLIKFDAFFQIAQGIIPVNFYNTTDTNFDFIGFYDNVQNKIRIRIKTAVTASYVILEYTKSTD